MTSVTLSPHDSDVTWRTWRYWLKLMRILMVTAFAALVIVPFAGGAVRTWLLTHPACNPGADPGQFGMTPYEDVTFPSTRGVIQDGYFIPGANGATVIVAPAYGNGRGGDMHYVDVFHRAGFNVLTMNSRACTSFGRVSLGYIEVEDVQAAYAYLKTRSDIDSTRVGLHGFSSAGATTLMAMGRIPEIRSGSAEGNYHDMPDLAGMNAPATIFEWLTHIGMRMSYSLSTGEDFYKLSPIGAIDAIAPRPILLIYGSLEPALPGAYLMLQRAQEVGAPTELWVVERAGHGGYLAVAREEFERRVPRFHQAALLGDSNPT